MSHEDETAPSRLVRIRGHGGTSLVADEWGPTEAPPVLLLHGGGQTRHAWGATAPTLAAANWRVVALDLRGHGDSDWPSDGAYEIDDYASDLLSVLEQLDRPPVLAAQRKVAYQLYAAVALVDVAPRIEPAGIERLVGFMLAHPDGFATLDEAADAVAAYLPHRQRPENSEGLRRSLVEGPNGRWRWRWDPRFLTTKPEFSSGDPGALLRRTEEMRHGLTDAARQLTVPTLLVRGAMSDVVSDDGARDFLEAVPHATYVDVAEAGHRVAGDRNDIFTAALLDFLRSDAVEATARRAP